MFHRCCYCEAAALSPTLRRLALNGPNVKASIRLSQSQEDYKMELGSFPRLVMPIVFRTYLYDLALDGPGYQI